MHNVEEVYAAIEREVVVVGEEIVVVEEGYGRVLAEGVRMRGDSPPFDRSQLDGFAVRSVDGVVGAELKVVGRQNAGGEIFSGTVGKGECVGINTGAMIPAGADGVLMVEHSEAVGEMIRVMRAVEAGYGIQRRGSDARIGEEVLRGGELLGAARVAAAVSAGVREVTVRRKVRVAVLTTGDELVGVSDGGEREGMIFNSNGPMLRGLVKEVLGASGEVIDLGTCGDVEAELRGRLERGLREADVVVVTGGMSMGTKDLVPGVLLGLGAQFQVEKVRMKPGKPFVFGTVERGVGEERKYVAGLPGNPVSAYATFTLFVRGILRRMLGGSGRVELVEARAGTAMPKNGDREFYQPCVLAQRGGLLVAEALAWRGSGDIFSLAGATGLIRRHVGAGPVAAGEVVEVVRLMGDYEAWAANG